MWALLGWYRTLPGRENREMCEHREGQEGAEIRGTGVGLFRENA